MMEFFKAYQLSVMMVLSGICGTLAVFVMLTKTLSKKRKLSLMSMELIAMFLLIFDRFSYIYRGDISDLGYWMVRISNFLVFLFTLLILYSYNMYLSDLCANELGLKTTPKRMRISCYFIYAGIFLLIISRFFNFYYTIDEANLYHRSSGFYICYAIPLIAMIIDLSIVIQHYKKLNKGVRISLVLFSVVPFVAAFLQIFAYGLSLVNISLVGTVVALYIFALIDMNDTIERAQNLEINILKEEQKNSQIIFEQTAQALSSAIDAKDKYTHGHSLRVAEYSRKIAKAVGLSEKECEEIYFAALLHDVGKIGIQDAIINKEGKLTNEEFAKIKAHPSIGKNILASINKLPYLSIGANFHHERYDGKGYPMGLKGEDIPQIARIIAVADAYDAMTSKRSYRDPLPQQKVREELVKGIGTQFDPEYAKEMVHMIDLDDEYTMKEREEVSALEGKFVFNFNDYRSDVSEGILITRFATNIKISWQPDEEHQGTDKKTIPSIILFDSLDGRTHDSSESLAKEMVYFEYCEIRTDGHATEHGNRKLVSSPLSELITKSSSSKKQIYIIQAVKYEDHLRLRITGEEKAFETIIALPDSARYAYIGLTGEYGTLTIDEVTKASAPIDKEEIPRIAEEISYITAPEGDIPNVQVNGWCTSSSEGIPIHDDTQISFHAMSLPTARLVWHCPYISVFTSDDGKVKGKNYREFCLMRLDGESWETDDFVNTDLQVNKLNSFTDWDTWKTLNKKGFDCKISIKKKGAVITLTTGNNGIDLKNIISITDPKVQKLYLALTGDQVALTGITVSQSRK